MTPTPRELVEALIPAETDMVEFVRSGGAAVAPEVFQHVSPELDIEFLPPALGGQIAGTGLEGMIESWGEWLEPYESYVITPEAFEEPEPGEILVLVRVQARTHRDGVAVEHAPAALFTTRDGILVRIRFYLDRDEARVAARG